VIPYVMHEYEDREALGDDLARHLAKALESELGEKQAATLALSGGRSPVRFLERLSKHELEWVRVNVTLVDERWLPPSNIRSNARLVETHLLRNFASAASFTPLYTGDQTPEQGLARARASFSKLPTPLSVVVLGMGEDGHTASLFSDADLTTAIDPPHGEMVAAIRSNSASEPRITLTVPTIVGAKSIVLHMEGYTKRRMFDLATEQYPLRIYPIRAVLERVSTPIHVFWAP
jgi:6-phosphogluconolactonase